MPAFQPQAFGKYFLVDKIAMGGMAEIFLAKPQSQNDPRGYLVIKRILPHFTGNAQFIDMFIDEAKISSLLSHVNIVPLYDLGKISDTYFLAMEYVPGQDLKGVVKRCGERGVRLSYEHAAFVMREVCLGLDYAHNKVDPSGRPLAIVHRDISPQNVLVGYDGQVKITDFGIAKASSKLDATQVGTLKGKFGYMAPEQVVAGMDLDHRADIFAAGVILWELITGQRLFAGRNEIEILERVRAARIDPPSTLDPDVPRELERIIFKALMKDRDKRYQWAKDMAHDLTRFLAQASPRFSAADMSAVMRELFAPEIEQIKTKFNVTIGPVIDRTHVEQGASLESTRPDHREEDDTQARASLPEPGRTVVAPSLAETVLGEEPGRTMVAPAPEERTSRHPEKTASGRYVVPPDDPPPARPLPPPPPPPPRAAERTSAFDLIAEIEAEAVERGIGREPTAPVGFDGDPGTVKKPRTRGRKGPKLGVRLASWGAFLGVAAAVAVGSLLYTGNIRNPWAPPILEIYTGVDTAAISIDGNVVLASGRAGRWPVDPGTRVVEVRAKGYEPFAATVEAAKGEVHIVDVVLLAAEDAVADLQVLSDPPGATVYLDDTEVGTTPLELHPRLGEHRLRFVRPGYDELVQNLRLTRPGESLPLDVKLVPNIASVTVTTVPPGADVSVDGTPRGKSPVTVEKLKPGTTVVQAVLKGHRTETRTVTLPGGDAPLPLEIELQPLAGAAKDLRAPLPAPTAAPARVLPPNMGLLSVDVVGGWGEVYVDGVRVDDRTPLEKAEIAAGQHTVRVVNPVSRAERTMTVIITAGKETPLRLSLQ